MGIAVTTMTVAKTHPRKTFFSLGFTSADIKGAEEILAAHATKPYYIEHLVISGAFAGKMDFGDGKSGSAVETIALTLRTTTTGIPWDIKWERPIQLTAAEAITIDGTEDGAGTAGPVAGMVEGFYIT